jgi:hypothetical protein
MATKTEMQHNALQSRMVAETINIVVGITDEKLSLSDVKKINNRATIFEVFDLLAIPPKLLDNQSATIRNLISKEICNSHIWVDVPSGTMTSDKRELAHGWNLLTFGNENRELFFSKDAINAIKNGLPVFLDMNNEWLRVSDSLYFDPNFVGRVIVIVSDAEQPALNAFSPFESDLEAKTFTNSQSELIRHAIRLEIEAERLRQEAKQIRRER